MSRTIKIFIQLFLLTTVLFTSCNGQVNSNLPEAKLGIGAKQPKIVKTQGSSAYDNIHCGIEDKAGNIWFGTTGEGVYRFDGKLFTQFTNKDGLSNNTVWCMLEDKAGNIWFGTDNGISVYNGKTVTAIPIQINNNYNFNYSNNNPSTKNTVWSIMQDKGGKLWFGTTNDVYCYNEKSFTRFLDNHKIVNDSNLTLKSVQCMLEDKKGNIWFGSGPMAFEGIALYNGKSLSKFKPKKEGWIRNIIEDKNNNLLFATRHNDVIAFDSKKFIDYKNPTNLVLGLLCTIIEDSKGNIWYSSDYVNDNDVTTGGLWKYDGKSFTEYKKQGELNNTSVSFLFEDSKHNIWIGTRNIGLFRFDGNTFKSYLAEIN